jgi:two-component system cell cycle response regulator
MHGTSQHRVILVDRCDHSRDVMVRRLAAQGYNVEAFGDPALGADAALAFPPSAVVADLWMPGVSGVQLCRLLRAEPATAQVPVILRGPSDDPRSRFWAERAGATSYVVKGRIRELVRALARATAEAEASDGFFMQLSGGSLDIRERIARHLDLALFDSVIAAEVRSLASCGSFERLFDAFSQFLPQVLSYRWMAIATADQFGVHHHPADTALVEEQARASLGVGEGPSLFRIEDEDARGGLTTTEPAVCTIPFGAGKLGSLAVALGPDREPDSAGIIELVARELGGPLRIAALMDESQRLATSDSLTGLANRRALLTALRVEIAHASRHDLPLSVMLMDVDFFKSINDGHGHAVGDEVLSAIGALLRRELRIPDLPARWGGEEFVVTLRQTDAAGGLVVAERVRAAVAALNLNSGGKKVPVTVSIGLAQYRVGDTSETVIHRADQAMYLAKGNGRNRVEVSDDLRPEKAAE